MPRNTDAGWRKLLGRILVPRALHIFTNAQRKPKGLLRDDYVFEDRPSLRTGLQKKTAEDVVQKPKLSIPVLPGQWWNVHYSISQDEAQRQHPASITLISDGFSLESSNWKRHPDKITTDGTVIVSPSEIINVERAVDRLPRLENGSVIALSGVGGGEYDLFLLYEARKCVIGFHLRFLDCYADNSIGQGDTELEKSILELFEPGERLDGSI